MLQQSSQGILKMNQKFSDGEARTKDYGYVLTGTNMRCHASHRTAGKWGDLGRGLTEKECRDACNAMPECTFLALRITGGQCTSFSACDRKQNINDFTTWERVQVAPTPEPATPEPVPPTPLPPQSESECKPWCDPEAPELHCTWAVCKKCYGCFPTPAPPPPPPTALNKNVLIILTDDLNVDVQGYKYGHAQAYTPNIDKLAQRGTRFQYAYAQHPICVPSRASFLTGIYGFVTKSMFTDKYWEYTINQNSRTLVEHFSAHGYKTYGTGKVGHKEKPGMFDVWGNDPDYGPLWVNEQGQAAGHPALNPDYTAGALDVSFGALSTAAPYITETAGWYNQPNNGKLIRMRYVNDDDRDPTPDEANAQWAVEKLGDPELKTNGWFMAVGFCRPHTPMHALDKHFAKFPIESLTLPEIKTDDTDDTNFPGGLGHDYFNYLVDAYGREEGLKLHLQAYLASVYAVDEEVGKVLDALEVNGFVDNTVVVLLSDHGWHEGQKDVLWKNTPWEEATRIPLIIADPDISPAVVEHPVALIDVYPTLIDLFGLSTETKLNDKGANLNGVSVKPLMENSSASLSREGVLSAIGNFENQWVYENCKPCKNKDYMNGHPLCHHMAVRTKEYRYIWVADGKEELYNHMDDPYEWTNLIGKPELLPDWEEVRAKMRRLVNTELEGTGAKIEPYGPGESAVPKATWR